jgi:Protein of unknown function (DUF3750)
MQSAQIRTRLHGGKITMLKKILKWFALFVVFTILVPIAIGASLGYARGWPENWKVASWASSGLLPEAASVKPARVMILATRTGRWKSIFAEHMSLLLKPEGEGQWTRYDVVGWGKPVRKNAYAADALWYGNQPRVIYMLDGDAADQLIPSIEQSIARYPFRKAGSYTVWPGLDAELPPVAVGKDWLGSGFGTGVAPSKTGYSFSISGVIGGTLALEEGLELHLLGSTIGIDPNDLAIKLPALGKLSLRGGLG